MVTRSGVRSIAIGGLLLTVALATGARTTAVHAQAMQQVGGFNAYDPQWAQAGSSMYSGRIKPGCAQTWRKRVSAAST